MGTDDAEQGTFGSAKDDHQEEADDAQPAEGIQGLYDAPRSGSPGKTTDEYRKRLLEVVRQRPRSLDQPYSIWTLERLTDFMAEETGIRVSYETVRRILKANGIVFRRPPDPEYQVKKRRLKSKEPV